jgi:hypothetical protein
VLLDIVVIALLSGQRSSVPAISLPGKGVKLE